MIFFNIVSRNKQTYEYASVKKHTGVLYMCNNMTDVYVYIKD